MKAVRLRTEYLKNPMGIDIRHPRLSWNCEGGATQTAYEIQAVSDGGAVWNSGRVESSSMWTEYPKELTSRQRVAWKVRLQDENGQLGEWSEEAIFEMGLLRKEDWEARWITGNYKVDKKRRYPVDCFRRVFSVDSTENARLYITACGLYEARLNGLRVGSFEMAPGHTDYRKRIQYQTYDVSEVLHAGENVLEVQLADGWYRGSTGAWGLTNQYGTVTKFIARLEAGGRSAAVTDESWDWSSDGPVRFADNKDGEIIDARMAPSYSGKAKAAGHTVIPAASNNVPVTRHEKLTRPQVITTPGGRIVLDFGQNIAGFISFQLQAKAGQKITLQCGELMDAQGEFTLRNIQCTNKKKTTPLQKVEFTCKDGWNEFCNRFSVFGFQYVLVETDIAVRPEDFTAIAVYSDLERTGWFESSNRLLDRFVENTVWSAKNNFLDVPTDCPTRERHGWSGDAQIFCKTASYLFNFVPFAKKYLNDMYDWQKGNGCLPQITPPGGVDFYMNTMNGSSGWADAGVLIPWVLYRLTADRSILEKYWDGMVKYAGFMRKRCGKVTPLSKSLGLHGEDRKYAVNCGQSYGEWAEPREVLPNHWTDMVFPHPEVSTAYTAYVMEVMGEIADVLGRTAEAEDYRDFASRVKKSYQAMRELPEFTLDTDRQAALVRPLYMNLLEEKQAEYAGRRLIKALENYGWRLGTGFLSTPLILYVLAEQNLDAAYRLLENEEIPGWLSMPKNGATTIWEDWEGKNAQSGIASLNHYSKGAVCEWLFSVMCGISVSGENHFVIAPRPGGNFTYARAEYQSVFGKAACGWQKEEGKIRYMITIPANCTAEIRLPDGRTEKVASGDYIMD